MIMTPSNEGLRRVSGRLGLAELPRKGAAADDALRLVTDAFAQLAVGGHHPDRRLELRYEARDLIVARLVPFPDDLYVMSFLLAPSPRCAARARRRACSARASDGHS